MSEGIHSTGESSVSTSKSAPSQFRRWGTLLGGTAVLAIGAGIMFQVLRPEPAASQTADRPTRSASVPPKSKSAAAPTAQQEALARVNNQVISYDAVAREAVDRHGREVLDNMVNRMLIQQECDRQGVEISRAEVEQEIAKITEKFKLPIDQWYAMLAAERGVTPEQYQNDVIWPMLALRKLAGLQAEASVTEEDMLHAFERDYGPRVKARMILVNGNVRQASQIWEKCKASPEKFEDLAAEFSADPNTRALGGAMPPIRQHGGLPQLEAVAFKLKEGEISQIVEIGEQHYILKCEGRTEQVITDPKDVWEELYAQVTEEKTQLAVANTFQEIRDRAEIHNYLDNTSSTPSGRASTATKAKGQTPVKPVSGSRTSSSKGEAPTRKAAAPGKTVE